MQEHELKNKSTEELRLLLNEYRELEVVEDLNQYVRKILINSVK